MKPLKQPEISPLCDPSLVDEMFYQIPEILEHHELFLEQVVSCVNDWHERQTIGDLLVQSVSARCISDRTGRIERLVSIRFGPVMYDFFF